MTSRTAVFAVAVMAGLLCGQSLADDVNPPPLGPVTGAEDMATVAQPAETTPVPNPVQADPIADAAAIYGTFQADVTDVKQRPLDSAEDITDALNRLGGHNSDQLARGWIAYSALIASQDPDYRAAIRDIESFYGREALQRGLRNDVSYAGGLDGAAEAVSAALAATDADSRRLSAAGAMVKEQAYSLQASGWAKGKIGDTAGLIARLQSATAVGQPVPVGLRDAFRAPDLEPMLVRAGSLGAPSLWETVSGAAGAVRLPTLSITPTQRAGYLRTGDRMITDRIATLAAYRITSTGDVAAGDLQLALSERGTAQCLNMAQLNLQQCIAAAHKHYEVPFCIGEHALTDVGECIGEVSR